MGVFPLTSLGFGSVHLNSASDRRLRSVLRVIWLVSSRCLLKINCVLQLASGRACWNDPLVLSQWAFSVPWQTDTLEVQSCATLRRCNPSCLCLHRAQKSSSGQLKPRPVLEPPSWWDSKPEAKLQIWAFLDPRELCIWIQCSPASICGHLACFPK